MKFEVNILIHSDNQDVVDYPKQKALEALDKAYKETHKMCFSEGSSEAVHAVIMDSNGNRIGGAYIDVEMGE